MSDFMTKRLVAFDLGDAEQAHLQAAGERLLPHLDRVLDKFYETAMGNPEMARFFQSERMIAHARSKQKEHWGCVLRAEFGDAYMQSAETVGRVHFRIELPFLSYLSSYARAASHLQTLLLRSLRRMMLFQPAQAEAMIGAVMRALSMDTELVIDAYFDAQEEEQKRAFGYLRKAVDALAQGDLTYRIPDPDHSDFPEAYADLGNAFNAASDRLGGSIDRLSQSNGALSKIVTDVQTAIEDLSQRTGSQAATLEETAAAIQQMTQTVSATSESTKEAKAIAQGARVSLDGTASSMNTATTSMHRIKKSSDEIQQIIGLIDDIVFQTNLLALNAGVEAARAGEAGKGFAVVATEVRGLASRAADAADEIKSLIGKSASDVQDGVTNIDAAKTTLEALISSFAQVADLTETITEATLSQENTLSEINIAVTELDTVTQQNAGMVQETTGMTERMGTTSQDLSHIVEGFETQPQNGPDIRAVA